MLGSSAIGPRDRKLLRLPEVLNSHNYFHYSLKSMLPSELDDGTGSGNYSLGDPRFGGNQGYTMHTANQQHHISNYTVETPGSLPQISAAHDEDRGDNETPMDLKLFGENQLCDLLNIQEQ